MDNFRHVAGGTGWIVGMSTAALVAAAVPAVALLAPTEATMGDAQRIVYLHVPVAWLGLLGLVLMAFSGAMYLRRRNLWWDHCSQAAAETRLALLRPDLGHRLVVGARRVGNLVDLGPPADLGLCPVDDLLGLPGPPRAA